MKNGVTINLDRPRTLRYGMNSLATIEDITGKSILSLDMSKVGVRDLLAIVYGGLYHEDKSLTLEKVGNLIDEYSNLNEIAEKIGEALSIAFGGDSAEKESGEK